jgi:hypothetical protein
MAELKKHFKLSNGVVPSRHGRLVWRGVVMKGGTSGRLGIEFAKLPNRGKAFDVVQAKRGGCYKSPLPAAEVYPTGDWRSGAVAPVLGPDTMEPQEHCACGISN